MMAHRFLKSCERMGRQILLYLCAWLLGVRAKTIPVPIPAQHDVLRILVVRLDERLGNVILLTPLLLSLAKRFPTATIDVVGSRAAVPLLSGLPGVRCVYPFAKRALLSAQGPVGLLRTLRQQRYDLVIDGANPTSISFTHAWMVRLSGGTYTIGSDWQHKGALYTSPVDRSLMAQYVHEIDLRLALLAPLGEGPVVCAMQVSPMSIPANSALSSFVHRFQYRPFVLINVGARLSDKMLRAADYALIANMLTMAGLVPVLSFGPTEGPLAAAVKNFSASTILAPPTTVAELAYLMNHALAVISCDTGPMHLAVALGRPTCGLFVVTDAKRYGHTAVPHQVVNLQHAQNAPWQDQVRAFVAAQRACALDTRAVIAMEDELTPLWPNPPKRY
jgi:heptosyltransferase-3